ncbi:GAF and ANTAR domain-containing protein [Mycobacterium paraense]|nr:GAF and ANTAR domain-containing protein [Mycobacterium paraense]
MVCDESPPFFRNGFAMVVIGHIPDPEEPRRGRRGKAVRSTIARLAGAMVGTAGIEDALSKLTGASLVLIPDADCAKVSIIENGHLRSITATSQLTSSLDRAQQAAGHGPCLETISAKKATCCNDLRTNTRWPRFAPCATTAGVQSVLSSPIDIPGETGATLTLFGFRANAFGPDAEAVSAMLAKHAAIALMHDERERQFKAALATRDVIGQAKGMIMERFGVDAARAFAMLTAISQQTNTPLRELATRLVDCARQ